MPALGLPAATRCVRIVDDPRHDRYPILLTRLDDCRPFTAPADDAALLTSIFLHDQNLYFIASRLDLSKTAMPGWKLPIASTTVALGGGAAN